MIKLIVAQRRDVAPLFFVLRFSCFILFFIESE